MKLEKSWARRQYELAYGLSRSYGEINEEQWTDTIPQEIIRAADYSYQAFGYELSGWVSDERRKRFHAIKWRINTKRLAPENNPPPIQIDIERW